MVSTADSAGGGTRSLCVVVSLVFGIACVGKAIDPRAAEGYVGALGRLMDAPIGPRWSSMLVSAVLGFELFIALAMAAGAIIAHTLARPTVRAAAVIGCVASACFVAATLVMTWQGYTAPCGCFGIAAIDDRVPPWLMVGRNLVLLLGCGLILILHGRGNSESRAVATRHVQRVNQRRMRSPPAGFTLIESLCVIVIVGALLSLLLPALRGAREQARALRSQSNGRQLVAVLETYARASQGSLPFFAREFDMWSPAYISGKAYGVQAMSAQAQYWVSFLSSIGVLESVPEEFFRSRGDAGRSSGGNRPRQAAHRLTFTAFSSPTYWSPRWDHALPPPDRLLHGQKIDSVTNPSAKGVLLDMSTGHWGGSKGPDRALMHATFFDGSAGSIAFWPTEAWNVVSRPVQGAWSVPVMSTTDGLHGRDR